MKLLLICPSLKNSGPINVVLSLIKNINPKLFKITVIYFFSDSAEYKQILQDKGVKFVRLDGSLIHRAFSLYQQIKIIKPDVIHSHCLLPDALVWLLSPFISSRKLTTIHCNLLEDYRTEYPLIKGYIYYKLHKIFLKNFNKVVTVSKSAGGCLDNIETYTIYNGVDSLAQNEQKIFKAENINFVFLGRLIPRKNVMFLVKAIEELKNKYDLRVTVEIFGDGPEFDELKEQASSDFIFHGFIDNPLNLISKESILVNPSYSEGMPMAVLEFISLGLPVLLSNISSHQELKDKIQSGVEIFDLSFESFEEAYLKIIKDNKTLNFNKQEMLENFNLNFSSDAMVQSYSAIYEQLSS
ncbi:glycosyltransferase family 4 protein [Thalassotalea fonticola]|uniref:Glycosyltransferase family 4 protein n=1 Tax=Thalassotalea fonticola TaxID=3065649 RepID=A0ABZ0GU60_9GAMM|nr:glycosyltransferase family 4 protein [Colwelliaceae bacterium S1-1]